MLPEEIITNIREREKKGKVDDEKRNILYNDLDRNVYHEIIKAHFENNYIT